jgi:hypothetical protein
MRSTSLSIEGIDIESLSVSSAKNSKKVIGSGKMNLIFSGIVSLLMVAK